MRIIVNTTNLSKGGGLQVADSFIRYLENDSNSYCLLISKNLRLQLGAFKFTKNCEIHDFENGPADKRKGLEVIKNLKQIERSFKPDVVFSVFGPTYWTPNAPHLMGYAIPHFIYKDSPFFKKLGFKATLRNWLQEGVKGFLTKRNADYYVVETDDVKSRLSRRFNINEDKVSVVNNYYHQVFDSYQLNEKYKFISDLSGLKLVCISAFYPHKNLEIIKEVVRLNKGELNLKFVITIPANVYEEKFSGLEESVINIGPVGIEDCPSVYYYSDFLFLPTLLECFTASYVEAMKMERPILTSDLSFAKTICQNSALYFDPLNAGDILNKITLLASDKPLQEQLILEGKNRLRTFPNAEKRTAQYLSICNEIYEGSKGIV